MATIQKSIKLFDKGVHNVLSDESIPKNAASDSLNWLTEDGRITLAGGRKLVGAEGGAGQSYGEFTAYKVDGTSVRYKKTGTKIQYFDGTNWIDVITGLTPGDMLASNYSSLAGNAVYFFSPDNGPFKICTANPTSYADMYDSTKNFKGYAFIDKGRTILWGRKEDKTGLYGSYIDVQKVGTTYTSVTGEATTSLSGTLAFKAGGAKRTCFGIQITVGAEVFTDNFNGVFTGSLGGTGTINYMTGAYTVSVAGAGTANYTWVDDTVKGVLDFSKSATRVAGEGFVFRNDYNGTPIKVVVPIDSTYFSLKSDSAYKLTISSNDTDADNNIYSIDIGVSTLRGAVATSKGIMFVNTINKTKPVLTIIERNLTGDGFTSPQICSQFKFEDYTYDDVMLETWNRFVLVACAENSTSNNKLLLIDINTKTVDVYGYGIRTATKVNGVLQAGSSINESTYEYFTVNDDDGQVVANYWDSAGDTYGDDALKKVKRMRFVGGIEPSQNIEVYMGYDNDDPILIGTIRGDGEYVDYTSSFAIGNPTIGTGTVGGDTISTVYPYFAELKVRTPKFRKRKIRFVATGIRIRGNHSSSRPRHLEIRGQTTEKIQSKAECVTRWN
jgi:hypothetical protein